MRKSSFVVMLAAAVASMTLWVIMTSLTAWAIVFITGALHSSGLTQIPALSFWQSVGIVTLLSLLAFSLRAGRNNGRRDRGR